MCIRVPNNLRSIHATWTIESMEVGTYYFTWMPSFKSQVWHGCLRGNIFWRCGFGIVLRVGIVSPYTNLEYYEQVYYQEQLWLCCFGALAFNGKKVQLQTRKMQGSHGTQFDLYQKLTLHMFLHEVNTIKTWESRVGFVDTSIMSTVQFIVFSYDVHKHPNKCWTPHLTTNKQMTYQ